jgi:hypothetical protein
VTPRRKSALLWGAVGALSFLVLAQGYVLVVGRLPLSILGRFGLALGVGGVATVLTYAVEPRVAGKRRN